MRKLLIYTGLLLVLISILTLVGVWLTSVERI
jgi:hypothetical protein